MYTLPHVYVFLPLHINNPIGIGFINSHYLPISSPPMAKPVRRGRERPAQLDPPGHQGPDPEHNSSPTCAHLDGSPAGRGLTRTEHLRCAKMGPGAPHLPRVMGMSSGTKSSPKMGEREGSGHHSRARGPARPGDKWMSLPISPSLHLCLSLHVSLHLCLCLCCHVSRPLGWPQGEAAQHLVRSQSLGPPSQKRASPKQSLLPGRPAVTPPQPTAHWPVRQEAPASVVSSVTPGTLTIRSRELVSAVGSHGAAG